MTDAPVTLPQLVVDTVLKATGAVSVGELDSGLPAVEGTVERDGRRWRLQVVSYPGDVLVAASFVREVVPPTHRDAAALFANRVNWALLVGDAEVDPGDGTVRICTSLCPLGTIITGALAEGMVGANVGTATFVLPGFERVAEGEDPQMVADEVLDQIEVEGIDLRLE